MRVKLIENMVNSMTLVSNTQHSIKAKGSYEETLLKFTDGRAPYL